MSTQPSRWRWLKRLFFACLFLLVALLAVAYYKLPPLAESAIRKAINSGDFVSKEFTVTSVGPIETILEGVDLASRGWRLQTPQLSTTYAWSDVQDGRLSEVVISQGVLTLDLDDLGKAPSNPKSPGSSVAPKAEAKSSAGTFPFDQLLARDLTVVLIKGDKTQTLRGTTSIIGERWRYDLSQDDHRLRGTAKFNKARQLDEVIVQSTKVDLPSWLAFFEVNTEVLGSLQVNEPDLKIFREGPDARWRFEGKAKGVSSSRDGLVTKIGEITSSGDVESFSGAGEVQDVTLQTESETIDLNGKLKMEFQGPDHLSLQSNQTPMWLEVGDYFSAPVRVLLTLDEGALEAEVQSYSEDDAGGKSTILLGQTIDGLDLKIQSAKDGRFFFNLPMLRSGAVSLEDVTGEVSTSTLALRGSHKIYYGQGEVYGPVPVTVIGKTQEDSWMLDMKAETLPGHPWQTYWKGLGFALHGELEAHWQTNEPAITLSARLKTVDVRRNESAVVLEDVSVQGAHTLSSQSLALDIAGTSRGQRFAGSLTSSLSDEARRFDYVVSKLNLPENTVLGAFAEALKEMPMAAFLDVEGDVVLPHEGEAEHRLRMKLARGVYRHPERKLAGRGIAGTFAIESFDPFVTVDDQRAIFGQWRMGDLELTEGTFLYKLGPQGAVLIKEAEAKGIGGRLTMKSLASHPGQPDFESVVTFDKIDLDEMANLIPGFKGKVGGRVSGQVHLRYRDGILSLPQGSLSLDETSRAFLHLNAKEALGAQLSEIAQDPSALEIVESALKDLVVSELEIGFFDPDNNESVCRIQLKGRSREEVPIPKTQGGKAFAPIHLNISVDDPSELVRRLLNFGLRKQLNTRLKPGG